MGVAIDTITTFKDSLTGGSFEALSVASGDSLALRFLDASADIELLEWWGADNATKCEFSIRSPLLHDNTRGIRVSQPFNPTLNVADGNPQLYMAPYDRQKYRPSDTLIVEANGTAADDVTNTQLVWYEGPAVPDSRFITYDEALARLVNKVGIGVTCSSASVTSTYGTAVSINTNDDRLKANTWYALIGILSDLPVTTYTIKGPETGNLRVPIPGHWNQQITAGWFLELARRFNRRMVPCFNANNKANIFLECADVGGGSTPRATLQFLELSGNPFGPY